MSILDALDAHYPSFQSWNASIGTRPQTDMPKLKVLDLFSGIGGFSLGLERTGGFETVAFCEIEPFPRRVLAKHWPSVPIYEDVRELTAERLAADGISVDVICGGFPCQDISVAGLGAGIEGERSGLWADYARLIGELRPQFVIVENVAALLSRGLDKVLGDLAAFGYDAEWHCVPASAVGAPHERDRLWLVAYTHNGQRQRPQWEICAGRNAPSGSGEAVARSSRDWGWDADCDYTTTRSIYDGLGSDPNVSNADDGERQPSGPSRRVGWGRFALENAHLGYIGRTDWKTEPNVGRVANGVSSRVDRLHGLGNAVVPQIPELIGHAILQSLREAPRDPSPTRPSSNHLNHKNTSQSGQEGRHGHV